MARSKKYDKSELIEEFESSADASLFEERGEEDEEDFDEYPESGSLFAAFGVGEEAEKDAAASRLSEVSAIIAATAKEISEWDERDQTAFYDDIVDLKRHIETRKGRFVFLPPTKKDLSAYAEGVAAFLRIFNTLKELNALPEDTLEALAEVESPDFYVLMEDYPDDDQGQIQRERIEELLSSPTKRADLDSALEATKAAFVLVGLPPLFSRLAESYDLTLYDALSPTSVTLPLKSKESASTTLSRDEQREADDLISRSTAFVKAFEEDIKAVKKAYANKEISSIDYPAVGYCLVYYNNYYTARRDIVKAYEDAFTESFQELDASGLPPAAVRHEKDNLWRRREDFYRDLDYFVNRALRSAPELTEARIAAAKEIARAKSEAKRRRPQEKRSAMPAPEGVSITSPPEDFGIVYGINLLYDANSQRWLARIGSSTRPNTQNLDATVGPLLKKIQDPVFYKENAGTLGMRFAEYVLVNAILPEVRKAAKSKAGRWQSVTSSGFGEDLVQEVYEKLIRPAKKGKSVGLAPIRSFDTKKYDENSPGRALIKYAVGLLTTATREELRREQAGGITASGDILGFKLIIKVGDKPTEVLAIDKDGSVSWVTVSREDYPDTPGEGSVTRKAEFTKNFIERELAGLSLGYYYRDKLERIDALNLADKGARFIAYYKDPETGKQSYSRRLEAMPQLETGEETLSVDDEGETSFYEENWEPGVVDEDAREDETIDVESEYYALGTDALAREGIETIEDLEEYLESRLEDASESRAALNAVRLLAVFALVLFYAQRSEADAADMKAYILHKFYGVTLDRISAMDIMPKKKGEGLMSKTAVKKRIDAVDSYVLAELKRLGLEVVEAPKSPSAPTAAPGKFSAKPVLRRIMNPRSSMYNPILAALIRYGRGYKRR